MFLDFYVKFTQAEGKFLKCNTVYSSNQIKWRERVRAPPWRWNPPNVFMSTQTETKMFIFD